VLRGAASIDSSISVVAIIKAVSNGRIVSKEVPQKGRHLQRALVSVVDDDESVRDSLPELLRELGFEAGAFASGDEFLSSVCVNGTRCLILDVAMPGTTGLTSSEN
jgi:PleD family two-component response regulator